MCGANVNEESRFGGNRYTPLTLAIRELGKTVSCQNIELLLQHGANTEHAVDDWGPESMRKVNIYLILT